MRSIFFCEMGHAWYEGGSFACPLDDIGTIVRQLERRTLATGRFGAAAENTPRRPAGRRDRQAAGGQEVRAPEPSSSWLASARMSAAEEEVACASLHRTAVPERADNCSWCMPATRRLRGSQLRIGNRGAKKKPEKDLRGLGPSTLAVLFPLRERTGWIYFTSWTWNRYNTKLI